MIFNTRQLQYLIEIERTRSISQAAANLYMGQPNLSRMLREMEEELGFPVFERTRKGVRPTEKGTLLLQHARNMLREADFMEQLGSNSSFANRFRICLPRSYCFTEQVTRYLSTLPDGGLDAWLRECHPRQALELLDSGSAEIAVIRYAMEYQDYFSEQAAQRKLTMIPLSTVEYRVVLSVTNPLAGGEWICGEDLESCTEIMHRDTFFPGSREERRQIYAVDRMAQMQMLHILPMSYFWSEPLPGHMLSGSRLKQLPCREGGTVYENVLVYKPQCAMSQSEKDFLTWIQKK